MYLPHQCKGVHCTVYLQLRRKGLQCICRTGAKVYSASAAQAQRFTVHLPHMHKGLQCICRTGAKVYSVSAADTKVYSESATNKKIFSVYSICRKYKKRLQFISCQGAKFTVYLPQMSTGLHFAAYMMLIKIGI